MSKSNVFHKFGILPVAALALALGACSGGSSNDPVAPGPGPGPGPNPPPPQPPPSDPVDASLWVPLRTDMQIHGYSADELALAADDDNGGDFSFTGVGTDPVSTTFDLEGNLWVADFGANQLYKYNADRLEAGGGGVPDVTITANAGSLNGPVGLAFDSLGNLWVANFGGDTVVQFAAVDLTGDGNPSPLNDLDATVDPYGIAFDSDGSLWVANPGNTDTVLRFSQGDLIDTDADAPTANIGGLNNPNAVAFDADGNLWIADTANQQVLQYTFDPMGAPVAGVTIPVTADSDTGTSAPTNVSGLAFDPDGNLWVVANTVNSVGKLTVAKLTMDGVAQELDPELIPLGNASGTLISFAP